jgi:putative redox protein
VTEVTAVSDTIPYSVEISDGKHYWKSDEPSDAGGGDSGPNPSALLLGSLGACMAITLRMYAARKQWPLARVTVRLRMNAMETPALGNEISSQIALAGALSAEQRERLLQIASACPMHKVLTGTIHIQATLAEPVRSSQP